MIDPIWVRCEGSDGYANRAFGAEFCQMCGGVIVSKNGRVVPHDRIDVLAMLARGDFDE